MSFIVCKDFLLLDCLINSLFDLESRHRTSLIFNCDRAEIFHSCKKNYSYTNKCCDWNELKAWIRRVIWWVTHIAIDVLFIRRKSKEKSPQIYFKLCDKFESCVWKINIYKLNYRQESLLKYLLFVMFCCCEYFFFYIYISLKILWGALGKSKAREREKEEETLSERERSMIHESL